MEQVCEVRQELHQVGHQHIRQIMDIQTLCQHIVGKTIVEAEAYYENSQLNLTLNDGTYIEITCDSVYSEVPELDD